MSIKDTLRMYDPVSFEPVDAVNWERKRTNKIQMLYITEKEESADVDPLASLAVHKTLKAGETKLFGCTSLL